MTLKRYGADVTGSPPFTARGRASSADGSRRRLLRRQERKYSPAADLGLPGKK